MAIKMGHEDDEEIILYIIEDIGRIHCFSKNCVYAYGVCLCVRLCMSV